MCGRMNSEFKKPRRRQATKTSLKKRICVCVCVFFSNLNRHYSNSFTLSNASKLFFSLIATNHIQVQKDKENLAFACLRPP